MISKANITSPVIIACDVAQERVDVAACRVDEVHAAVVVDILDAQAGV